MAHGRDTRSFRCVITSPGNTPEIMEYCLEHGLGIVRDEQTHLMNGMGERSSWNPGQRRDVADESGLEYHPGSHPWAEPRSRGGSQSFWLSVVGATGGSRTREPLLIMVHGCQELLWLLAFCRSRSTRMAWFTDCRGWRAVVLGNHPISVRQAKVFPMATKIK
jgi:hypothetical protein